MNESNKTKLSVIVPAYNEADTISEVIGRVVRIPIEKEIIIIDDGSSDATTGIIAGFNNPCIKKIFNKKNIGKGAAVKSALPLVEGDIVIIQDADLEYYPEEYPKLLEPLMKNEADVVFGSRFLEPGRYSSPIHFLGNKILNFTANILYFGNLTDLLSCYKVFRTGIIKNINIISPGFGFEAEITGEILRRRYRVKEIPISYISRDYSQGKKIKRRDFFILFWWLLRTRFKSRPEGRQYP